MAIPNTIDAEANITIIQGVSKSFSFRQERILSDNTREPVDCSGTKLRFALKRYGSVKPLLEFDSNTPAVDPVGSHPFDKSLPPVESRIYWGGTDENGNVLTTEQAAAVGKYILSISSYQTAKLNVDDYLYEIERVHPNGTVVAHSKANFSIVEQAGSR